MRKELSIGVLVLVLAFAPNLLAQGQSGTIRGTVLDPTGAAVPGATVTVTNVATGLERITTTSGSGLYNTTQLTPGIYVVAVELSGFKRAIQDGVEVNVAGVVGLDFTLELGAVAESVEVTAAAPQLRTETTEIGTVLPIVVLTDLPIQVGGSGRSPMSFIFLTPGASSGGLFRPRSGQVQSRIGNTFSHRVNGGQFGALEQHLDGLSLQAGAGLMQSANELSMPPEAIQEGSLASGTASAETFSGGGVARFTTRSGTNEFHGNLYEYWRNDYLDARGFFRDSVSKVRWNEFGVSIGGPIIKDKSFFFLNVNWFRRKDAGGSSFLSVPTRAFKSGDLSTLLGAEVAPGIRANQIFDPATTRGDGQGGFTRDPFPGNIIPSARISRISQNVIGFLADPTSAGDFDNFLSVSAPTKKTNKWTLRIDHRIKQKHSISAMFNRNPNPNLNVGAIPFPHGQTTRGGLNETHARFAYDYVISATVTNHLAAGYNRQWESYFVRGHGDGWADMLGFPTRGAQGQAPFTGIHDGAFPVITMAPFAQVSGSGGTIDTNTNYFQNAVPIADTLSVIRGKHNMKIGMDYRFNTSDQFSDPSNGLFEFARAETAFPSAGLRGSTGFPFGSFLLGEADSAALLDPAFEPDGLSRPRAVFWGVYFQDDFKVTPTFTLNIGLRWDVFAPMTFANDNFSGVDITLANPGAGGLPGALVFAGEGPGRNGSSRVPGADSTNYANFAPRFGLAWRFAPSTVLRVGYGMHYFGSTIHLSGNLRRSGLGFEALPTIASKDLGVTSAFNWDNVGFPNYLRPPLIDPAFANEAVAWAFHEQNKVPYRQEWSLNIQHQLPGNWLVDVGYFGNKGTRLSTGVFDINQLHPSFLSLGSLLTQSIDDPAVAAAGFGRPYPSYTGSLGQALRPFPHYFILGSTGDIGARNFESAPIGNSTYHSLQLKLERRLTRGLYLLSSFRWQKMLTDADSNWGSFFAPRARDHYNRQLEKAISPSDLAARFVSGFMYELPFGPGKLLAGGTTGVAAKVLGGWQINGIITYQTGNPIAVVGPDTTGNFARRPIPNVVAGVNQLGVTSNFDPGRGDQYLNPAAFSTPDSFTFGNAPAILGVRTFPFYNENVGLLKRTNITERVNIEWRIEFFNLLNRVRFGSPLGVVGAPNFGTVAGAGNNARQGQMGLKINF